MVIGGKWKPIGVRMEKVRDAVLGTTLILVVLALVTLPAIRSAFADEFLGGGYRVTIEGFAGDARYTGCDPKGRCLTIEPAFWCERGAYIWENNGFTYSMSPTKERDGSYWLKIRDSGGKVILKQHMTPVAGASGQDD
jgi:hypothetical protein